MHFGVAELMLEFTQEFNLHVREDLHLVHNFVVTGVEGHGEVQLH